MTTEAGDSSEYFDITHKACLPFVHFCVVFDTWFGLPASILFFRCAQIPAEARPSLWPWAALLVS